MAYKNLPDLRFNGFSGKWKQEKFNNFVKRISETSSSKEYKKIEFSDIDSGILKNKLRNNDSKGIKFLKKDVLFGKLRPYLKNWYYCNFDGIAIGDFWVYRAKKDYSNSTFIYYLIQTEKYNLVANYTTGTKMPRSDWNIVSNTLFGLPSFNEQQKIGSFFEKLDKLIELQTQKLDQLKKLKRGYLQKMFPQEGGTVPRLRFSGFSGEWKVNYIGNMALVTKLAGFEFSKYVTYSDEGNIIALRGLNVKNDSLDLSDVKYIDNSDFSKLKRSKLIKGDILFTYVGTVGNSAIIQRNDKFYLAPNVALIRIDNESLESIFFQKEISTNHYFRKIIYPLAASSSQMALSMESIRKFKIWYCSIYEQQKIGDFFAKLDKLIEEQSNKLDQLKQQKKAYLQKMFI